MFQQGCCLLNYMNDGRTSVGPPEVTVVSRVDRFEQLECSVAHMGLGYVSG